MLALPGLHSDLPVRAEAGDVIIAAAVAPLGRLEPEGVEVIAQWSSSGRSGGRLAHSPRSTSGMPVNSAEPAPRTRDEADVKARAVFEEFKASGGICMAKCNGEQCAHEGVENLSLEGSFTFENSRLTFVGPGFYCSVHAYLACQASGLGLIEGVPPSKPSIAMIARRADVSQRQVGLELSKLKLYKDQAQLEASKAKSIVRNVEESAQREAELLRMQALQVVQSQALQSEQVVEELKRQTYLEATQAVQDRTAQLQNELRAEESRVHGIAEEEVRRRTEMLSQANAELREEAVTAFTVERQEAD